MSTGVTYLLRHAPSVYSVNYRVNGDSTVPVPLTAAGVAACQAARTSVSHDVAGSCVTSTFDRCVRTGELVTAGQVEVSRDARLNELDYGAFEDGAFLDYAHWLAEHGPNSRPPSARESQTEGIARMLTGLRAVAERPAPRLVVAHGLLVSVIRWARLHPYQPLTEVFLPTVPCLTPLVIVDAELRALTEWLLCDLDHGTSSGRRWHVDLGAFPPQARSGFAAVSEHALANGNQDEETSFCSPTLSGNVRSGSSTETFHPHHTSDT
jgi:probable phosphoglycerate mutase